MSMLGTLAELAASPGPSTTSYVRVVEVDATYEFVVGDTTTPDGWTAIAPTAGTAGTWLLRSDCISLAPLGTGADDWPRLIAGACSSMSMVGAAVRLRAGTWLCQSVQPLPNSGLTLIGGTGVVVVSMLTPDPLQPGIAPFVAQAGNISASSTVAATNVLGTSAIDCNTAISAGSIIRIRDTVSGSGFRGNTYTVQGVSGSGPFHLLLDRPVLFQFGAGDAIEVMPQIPSWIRILGNGMQVTGTGTRLLEFLGSRHCLVSDVCFVPDSGMAIDLIASFDVFGYDNEYSHCEVDGGSTGAVGLALETQERSRITGGCTVSNCAEVGFALFDCAACLVEDAHAWANNNGLSITADGNTDGCTDVLVRGGSFNGNTSLGIGVHNGSRGTRIVDACARFNDSNLIIGDAASTVSDTFVRGKFDSASTAGVTVIAAVHTSLSVDVSSSSVGANLGAGSDVQISRLIFEGATAPLPNGQVIVSAADRVEARGISIACTSLTNVVTIAGGQFEWLEGTSTAAADSNLFNILSGAVFISHFVGAVSGGGTGVSNAGGTVCLGAGVDLSACAIPLGGAGTFNLGTVQLAGASPVAMAQTNITAQHQVVLTRASTTGTPGASPQCVITPGVGFSLTATAGDLSTYSYKVV